MLPEYAVIPSYPTIGYCPPRGLQNQTKPQTGVKDGRSQHRSWFIQEQYDSSKLILGFSYPAMSLQAHTTAVCLVRPSAGWEEKSGQSLEVKESFSIEYGTL